MTWSNAERTCSWIFSTNVVCIIDSDSRVQDTSSEPGSLAPKADLLSAQVRQRGALAGRLIESGYLIAGDLEIEKSVIVATVWRGHVAHGPM